MKSPPANGQIESDVVADVSVPSTGDKRASRRGGSMRGRRGVGGGKRPSTLSAFLDLLCMADVRGSEVDWVIPHPHLLTPYPASPRPTQALSTSSGPIFPSKSPSKTAKNSAMTAKCCPTGRAP